jgi:hypothetical protein
MKSNLAQTTTAGLSGNPRFLNRLLAVSTGVLALIAIWAVVLLVQPVSSVPTSIRIDVRPLQNLP